MIGHVELGNYPKGLLYYCYYDKTLKQGKKTAFGLQDVRGEIIYIQNLSLEKLTDGRYDMDSLTKQFTATREKNRKLAKFTWHHSFSFPPGEKPTVEQIREISLAFAEEFGFENNQMVVFRHMDKNHDHFHIAANRINYNGKNTADHFNNYARTGNFCRKMEQQLGLQMIAEMHLTDPNRPKNRLANNAVAALKELIDMLLPQVQSVEELKEHLNQKGVKTYLGRGIAFVSSANGMKVKGSEIGREYSLANLEKRSGQPVILEPAKTLVTELRKERRREIRLR